VTREQGSEGRKAASRNDASGEGNGKSGGKRRGGSDGGKMKGRTCSDSIRAFRISSLLFEIGTLSSPSLLVSSSDSEIKRHKAG
jgi:hypothetical protein